MSKDDEKELLENNPVDRVAHKTGVVLGVFIYCLLGGTSGLVVRAFSFSTEVDFRVLATASVFGMSIVLKTVIMVPVMSIGAYLYASALVAVGRRTSPSSPSAIAALAGTLVWLAYIPFLLAHIHRGIASIC